MAGLVPSEFYDDARAVIDRARSRSHDSDDDALRPAKDTIERAIQVVDMLGPRSIPSPHIVTVRDSRIELEWRYVVPNAVFEIRARFDDDHDTVCAGYAHDAVYALHDITHTPREAVTRIRDCFDINGV